MDKLLSGLILAAVSGLTFLAYRHPKAYDKLFQPLMFSLVGIFLAVNFFELGFTIGHDSKDSEPFPFSSIWIYVGFVLAYLYFKFLAMLPQILEEKPEKKGKPDDEA